MRPIPLLRTISLMAVAVCWTLVAGCGPFDVQFSRTANVPLDATRPLDGAWEGNWVRQLDRFGGSAKVLFLRQADADNPALWMELWWTFPPEFRGDFQTTNVHVDPPADGAVKFHAKLAEGALRVMNLEGIVQQDTMTIHFESVDTTDPDVQLDKGEMTLHRVVKK